MTIRSIPMTSNQRNSIPHFSCWIRFCLWSETIESETSQTRLKSSPFFHHHSIKYMMPTKKKEGRKNQIAACRWQKKNQIQNVNEETELTSEAIIREEEEWCFDCDLNRRLLLLVLQTCSACSLYSRSTLHYNAAATLMQKTFLKFSAGLMWAQVL